MKKLTLVVPIYNTEKYIKNNKELWKRAAKEFEVIFVHDTLDGNLDNLASELGVHYFKKKNGNWGSVINFSKDKIKTNWVKIIDADDTFNIENLSALISENENADLIIGGVQKIYDKKAINMNYANYKKRVPFIHSMIMKSEYFKNMEDIPEGISYMDTLVGFYIYENVKTIVFDKRIIYKHLNDLPEQSTSKINMTTNKYSLARIKIVDLFMEHTPKNKAVKRELLGKIEDIIWTTSDNSSYKNMYKKIWSIKIRNIFTHILFINIIDRLSKKRKLD